MFPKGSTQNYIIFCPICYLMALIEFCILGGYVAEFYWTFMFLLKYRDFMRPRNSVFKCFCFFLNPERIFSMTIEKQKTI